LLPESRPYGQGCGGLSPMVTMQYLVTVTQEQGSRVLTLAPMGCAGITRP